MKRKEEEMAEEWEKEERSERADVPEVECEE